MKTHESQSDKLTNPPAQFFAVSVGVICRMEDCSLISFRGRTFVIETSDLDVAHEAAVRSVAA